MKLLDRIKIWSRKATEKAMPITELDKALEVKKNLENTVKKIRAIHEEAVGERMTAEKQVQELEEVLEKCNKKLEEFKANNDKIRARKAWDLKQDTLKSLNNYKAKLETEIKMEQKLKEKRSKAESKLLTIKTDIEQIKMKERYADTVNKYTDILNGMNESLDLNDIKYNVDVKFNMAEFKSSEIDEEDDIKSILEDNIDNDFENFFNSKDKKQGE